jgi:hypothetical protein
MKGRKLSTALLGALVGVILASSQTVFATHTPADKVVAAGDKMVVMGPGTDIQILTATLRTSKPTDLILSVAMECSILTMLTTGPSAAGGSDSATAEGQIRAWVEIDGAIVPINSISNPPQPPPPPGDDSDKVTFCSRTYSRTVTDTENPLDGQDTERDFINTKDANSFNWLRLNMGAGIHRIVVKATLTEAVMGDATAEAVIGNRSLIAEPEKLANDATI